MACLVAPDPTIAPVSLPLAGVANPGKLTGEQGEEAEEEGAPKKEG